MARGRSEVKNLALPVLNVAERTKKEKDPLRKDAGLLLLSDLTLSAAVFER